MRKCLSGPRQMLKNLRTAFRDENEVSSACIYLFRIPARLKKILVHKRQILFLESQSEYSLECPAPLSIMILIRRSSASKAGEDTACFSYRSPRISPEFLTRMLINSGYFYTISVRKKIYGVLFIGLAFFRRRRRQITSDFVQENCRNTQSLHKRFKLPRRCIRSLFVTKRHYDITPGILK